ncbi:recombinase family protein [Kitasatospora sp. NPDC056138]|uniref:recombinase family protein n=1 Tax=Kitasatospora sp. NPDC056138 TaxID=3345724 RepID=UPI0035DF00C4
MPPPRAGGGREARRKIRSSRVTITLVVHGHERLGCGIELVALAGELKAGNVGRECLTGEPKGSHTPSAGTVFTVFTVLAAMSGMEHEYIRDRTLEGHQSARKHGKTTGGAGVTDEDMMSMALHPRDREMNLRDIAKQLVITTGTKKGRHEEGLAPLTRHRAAAGMLQSRVISWVPWVEVASTPCPLPPGGVTVAPCPRSRLTR